MKNNSKSPDTTEVTPSKKKLKQARLPFMVLSDVSPKTINPRKRKLSDQDETESKISKISNENDLDVSIVISDEECTDKAEAPKEDKNFNPFVKLVDAAYKKKIQKCKTSKKKKVSKKHPTCNGSIEVTSVSDNEIVVNNQNMESMQVDEDTIQNGDLKNDKDAVENDITQKQNKSNVQNASESIVIEDSNEPTEKNTLILKAKSTIVEKVIGSECENNLNDAEKESQVSANSDKTIESPVTPKRSLRSKVKVDKLNISTTSSKLDESVTCTPASPKTPRQNKGSVNGQGDESLNSSTNLTPKQIQKKIESAKKKEEREKEKTEREKKRQQEKEERARQKQEKEEQRIREKEEKEAAKRKEKEEKEEQRRKEKEEKEKQKELEKKLREEKEEQKRKEREEKEEQKKKEREAREEEKRKKQEAADLEKQEQELKKKKAAEAFVNFFVPKQKVDKDERTIETSKNSMLSTFAIKSDMRLAPTIRHNISEDHKKELEHFITKQGVPESKLYLKCLKNGVTKPLSSEKTWPLGDKDDDDDDVVIVEDELPPMDMAGEIVTCHPVVREKLRPKLFSFHENRRPPYWGTWRKKSSNVTPRKPFGQDMKHLDYEVDSDDDWEEEAEGESLDGSAGGSDDEQGNDEYELDNEVFVPHGYLSDEEATMDEEDVLTLSPEAQKQKLKHLEEEFESELKKPTEKLKPRLYGLLWETSDGGKPENCVDALWSYFGKLAMIVDDPAPHMKPPESSEEVEKKRVKKKKEKKAKAEKSEEQPTPKVEKKQKLENKETNKSKTNKLETKKVDLQKKNQPGINSFLKKLKPAT